MLLKNGYPLSFKKNQIRKFLNNKYQFNLDNNSNYQPCAYQRCIFFKLSYIGSTSLQVEKELDLFFKENCKTKLNLFLFTTLLNLEIFFLTKINKPLYDEVTLFIS